MSSIYIIKGVACALLNIDWASVYLDPKESCWIWNPK